MNEVEIDPIIEAAQAGATILKKYFGQAVEVTQKSTAADLVSKADVESEQAIIAVLAKHFPDFNIQGEESGLTHHNSSYTFYIDPLDGTNNFLLGIPNFSTSIGLVKDGHMAAGVVMNPLVGEVYHAQRAKGAYLDDNLIHVSKETVIARSTIGYSAGYSNHRNFYDFIAALSAKDVHFKRLLFDWSGAFDLCLVASGKVEVMFVSKLQIHDHVAAKLIAQEAGALITKFDGVPEQDELSGSFLITNGSAIHAEMVAMSKQFVD